jgi:hypothetical protein
MDFRKRVGVMNKEPWLKWSWVYASLDVETFSTLDDALNAAWYGAEAGTEAFDHIEGPDGVVDKDIIHADQERRSDANWEEYQSWPDVTHRVLLRTLDDKLKDSAVVGSYTNEADAETEAAKWRESYGDRVTIEKVGP